jgi:hypothetical protein
VQFLDSLLCNGYSHRRFELRESGTKKRLTSIEYLYRRQQFSPGIHLLNVSLSFAKSRSYHIRDVDLR